MVKLNELKQSIFLTEASKIGDDLITKSKSDENGLYWETMTIDLNQNLSWETNLTIYSGVSGICLFFIELFKKTKEKKYLNIVEQSSKWISNNLNSIVPDNFSLLCGSMGAVYTLMEASKITGGKKLRNKAIQIAHKGTEFLQNKNLLCEHISGVSGSLLGFLLLFQFTKDIKILPIIDNCTKYLLENVKHDKNGIYWDRKSQQVCGLCGFSHGNAGIAFVFLELFNIFGNSTFKKIADLAFKYENNLFNKYLSNWPDFRGGVYDDTSFEETKEAFYNKNMNYFTRYNNPNAWCHGAAGIGLSRIRAFELFKEDQYLLDSYRAINKTVTTDIENLNSVDTFSLCHGGCGNAELFLEAYRVLKKSEYLEYAFKVAMKAIENKTNLGFYRSGYSDASGVIEDNSLFMGNAGIGYFFLRLHDPDNVKSMQALRTEFVREKKIDLDNFTTLTISSAEAKKIVLLKTFIKTFYILDKYFPNYINAFLYSDNTDYDSPLHISFITFCKNLFKSQKSNKLSNLLFDVLSFEEASLNLDLNRISFIYLHIKDELINNWTMSQGDTQEFVKQSLTVDPSTSIHKSKWDWSDDADWKNNIEYEDSEFNYVIKVKTEKVMVYRINSFCFLIINQFSKKKSIHQALSDIIQLFKLNKQNDIDEIKSNVIKQIRSLLNAGFLIPALYV